jgi:1-pyrroline-5-carboxylate dehydrogenase
MAAETFKLTYSTMFNPPEEMHTRFDEAVQKVKAELGKEIPIIIDGKEIYTEQKLEDHSPVNTDLILAKFQKGTKQEADDAVKAARAAFLKWSQTPWQERIAIIRKAASLIDERVFEMGAVLALEVGKNRMEAIGDIAETADLMRYNCDAMEKNNGFVADMLSDPLPGVKSTNVSKLRPYGVWLVISPFNFPGALTGGPASAALVAGNTVVIKPSNDTPYTPYLFVKCLLDAGIPAGVVNFITGPGSVIGQAMVENPEINGVTFTGSYPVGMGIYRSFAERKYVHPVILELGGKNPAIVTRHADVEDAALGIVRSAFGLQGQKCSACSRVFVEEPLHDALVERIVALTKKLAIGDPTARETYMGPVINKSAYADYEQFVGEVEKEGKIRAGGKKLVDGDFGKGYFVEPTVVTDLPLSHHLWQDEMFLPIVTIAKVKDAEEAMRLANDVNYGLTAGFYGSEEEVEWFYEYIQAGVVYANRPQGATTGAWPGYQPFGGWKASGASGTNAGGLHYLQRYMHEQIQNRIRKA